MQALKDKLTALTDSGRFNFSSTVSWLGDTIQHTELTNLFQTLADKLVPLIKAGVYNGKVVLSYNNSDPLIGHFTNGLPKVIMTTDPNGKETNVILISEDGDTWYSMPDVNSPQGIYGFN